VGRGTSADAATASAITTADGGVCPLVLGLLALRAELERKAGADVPPPERYVDLSYYERAMQLVGR